MLGGGAKFCDGGLYKVTENKACIDKGQPVSKAGDKQHGEYRQQLIPAVKAVIV